MLSIHKQINKQAIVKTVFPPKMAKVISRKHNIHVDYGCPMD